MTLTSETRAPVGARPVRLQLSRKKGFDLQALSHATNGLPAAKVSRPGKFGNPFTLEDAEDVHQCNREMAHHYATGWFREWLTQPDDHHDQSEFGSYGYLRPWRTKLLADLPELGGKNLACFCRPGFDCHADVLLELANGPVCAPLDSQNEGAEPRKDISGQNVFLSSTEGQSANAGATEGELVDSVVGRGAREAGR